MAKKVKITTTLDSVLWEVDLAEYCRLHGLSKNEAIELALKQLLVNEKKRL